MTFVFNIAGYSETVVIEKGLTACQRELYLIRQVTQLIDDSFVITEGHEWIIAFHTVGGITVAAMEVASGGDGKLHKAQRPIISSDGHFIRLWAVKDVGFYGILQELVHGLSGFRSIFLFKHVCDFLKSQSAVA